MKIIRRTMKHFILRLLFGKPLIMSVYQDKYGNKYGGFIHEQDNKSYVDTTSHIEEPTYLGELKIY
jgi:uncharacterized protein YhaN